MAARPEAVRDLFARQHRAERQASAQGFGKRHNIRFDAEMFIAEEFSGSSHAGLHFIEDQQQAALIADFSETAHDNPRPATMTPPSA